MITRISILVLAINLTLPAVSSAAEEKVYVAFRMRDWQAKHIHDAKAAKDHAATLKTLGCEVKSVQHDGHTDVQCRTVLWKSLELKSHDQAHQWVSWLQKSGFETIHGHKAGTLKSEEGKTRELVQFRSTEWKSQHIHDSKELNQLLALYRGMGLTVKTDSHNGHTDVKATCPEWMEISLTSHEAAHKWEEFLKEQGFETKHVH